MLNRLGYDAGPVDGLYGRNTRDAVRAFQADRGLPLDGAVTDELLAHLSESASASIVQTASGPLRETVRTATSAKAAELGLKTVLDGRILASHDSAHSTEADAQALARYIDLVELGLDDSLLDDPNVCWAVEYLPEPETAKYARPIKGSLYSTPGWEFQRRMPNAAPYIKDSEQYQWIGANEFEFRRAKQAFVAAEKDKLKARAIAFPLEFVFVDAIPIGNYDASAQAFALDGSQFYGGGLPPTLRGQCFNQQLNVTPPAYVFPQTWPVDAQAAEAILDQLPSRQAYLAVTVTLRRIDRLRNKQVSTSTQASDQTAVWSGVSAIGIYRDAELRHLIAKLPVIAAKPPVVLTGISKTISPADAVILDNEAIALQILKEHGDILGDKAWQALARRQQTRDEAYFRGAEVSAGGESDTLGAAVLASYDRAYTPFFPYGYSVSSNTPLADDLMSLFKTWVMDRAKRLPATMIYPADMQYTGSQRAAVVGFEEIRETDDSKAVQALLQTGLARSQIVLPERSASAVRADDVLAGKNGQRSAFLTLPSLAADYSPRFSSDEPVAQSDAGFVAPQYRLRITSTQLIPLPDGDQVVVVHATPTRLVVWDREHTTPLYKRDFVSKTLDPARLDYADSSIQAPPSGPMPLSAETMDLLIAKYLPNSLTDSAIERMMLARWAYESQVEAPETPDWGRFFVPGKPKPDAAQRAELASRFKAWTLKRAAAMPSAVTAVFSSPLPNAPGPLKLGAGPVIVKLPVASSHLLS